MINIVEHVKGLFVERGYVYSLANLDLRYFQIQPNLKISPIIIDAKFFISIKFKNSIHEIVGEKYMMKSSIPGKFPVTLFGEKTNARSKYIAILSRDGKGITIIRNGSEHKFSVISVNENLHDMIVNSMKGYGDCLFSCDYAGKVIKTQMLDGKLKEIASVATNSGCANCIEVLDDKIVYVGSSDGTVKKISFN